MKVAILGTGKMGAAMARRLDGRGHELTLWNRTPSRAEAVGVGQVAGTPAEAVRGAEVVISILTDARAVRDVYLGRDGAVSAAADQVFVEMSTAGPEVAREVERAVKGKGATFIACPVLGSTPAIESGKGTLLAAADDAAIDRARPVLEAIGEIHRMKDAVAAATFKLVANTALTGISAIAVELLAAGEAAGLDREDVFWALTRLVPSLGGRKAGYVDHRYEPVTFALRDALKDLTLANEVFSRAGAETPVAKLTQDLFERAAETAGDKDMSAIGTLYEDRPAARKR